MDQIDSISGGHSMTCPFCPDVRFEDLDPSVVRALYFGHMRRKHSDD